MSDNRRIDQCLQRVSTVEGQGGSILQVLTDHSCLQSSGTYLGVPEAHAVDGNKVRVASAFPDSPPEDVTQGGDLLVSYVADFWGCITASKLCFYCKMLLQSRAQSSSLSQCHIWHTYTLIGKILLLKRSLDTNQHQSKCRKQTMHTGAPSSGVCSHYGSSPYSSRFSWLSPVRPTFELIRPSQFLRCPPWDSTATSTLNWFICSVMCCWAETEREEMLQWNHCLHARLQG